MVYRVSREEFIEYIRSVVTSVDAVGVEGWEMGREVTEERRSPVYYTAVVCSKQFPKR